MPDLPHDDAGAAAASPDPAAAAADPSDLAGVEDGPLRIFSEQLGVDFDAVVARAKQWVAEHPLPPDLGPEPFNVGRPRPPVDLPE